MSAVVRGSSDWSVLNQSQVLVLIMSDICTGLVSPAGGRPSSYSSMSDVASVSFLSLLTNAPARYRSTGTRRATMAAWGRFPSARLSVAST
jgi:hypothetical protein